MQKRTLRHMAVASATATLIITMAGPAMACSLSDEMGGRGRTKTSQHIGAQSSVSTQRGSRQRGQNQRGMRKSRLQEKTEVSCSMEREARREAKKSLETSFRDARTERDAVLAQAKTLNDGLAVRVASHMARADYAADCEEILHEYRT